ncbi:MinD/ParA family ATP-binding protein [Mycolicibacter arupensis]|uniref:MinD/ParA family ATP-binding protein n=1 Tax=Mycolicibacter arupensis TaxID=342002 RepID=UPI000B2C4D2C|nr:MinD/ParA family protein [Mycolicibacter arupensis]
MNADDDFLRERVPPPQQQPRPWSPPPQQPQPQPQPAPYLQPAPMVRPQPTRGWRRVVLSATLGLVNLGPSPAEREEATYLAAIRSLPNGSYKVGVLGKGGVGKTTVAASVGSVFAALRRADHVVAVDADTAFGRLGSRIDPHATSSYWDLAADQGMQSFSDISSRVGANAAGLYVLVGEPAAGKRRILDAALYREAALRLDRHFTISIIDCGSTMDSPVTQEALRDLDALIVVSSPWADGAGAAAKTMEWLADRGQGGLLQRTVVVLNDSDGHADKRTRSALTAQFLQHGQAVVEVPFDPHLRPGGVIDVMSEMAPGTRRRFLQIAAIVAHYFASRPRGRDTKPGRPQST